MNPSVKSAGYAEQLPEFQGKSCDEVIYHSWMHHLQQTLGRDERYAHSRAMVDVTRERAKEIVANLRQNGWPLERMSILDLGSGHGTLAIELALAGAAVTAVEPGESWRRVAIRRSQELDLDINHLSADGANLPFPDQQFDGLISHQVLEHVDSPTSTIKEMSRVLRVGGLFNVVCENYLAFREQHYGVFWLPLMPRAVANVYLRARGRDPEFFNNHVTYTTWPGLLRDFVRCGLIDDRWLPILAAENGQLPKKHRWFASLAGSVVGDSRARMLALLLANRSRWFGVGFVASGRKIDPATSLHLDGVRKQHG